MPPSTPKQKYTFTTSTYPPILLSTTTNNNKTTLLRPTPSNPSPSTNNPLFTASMHVRTEVFIKEQQCNAEMEIDDDDARSWGWVVFAQKQQPPQEHQQDAEKGGGDGGDERGRGGQPVGTIRLVPPPHVRHSYLTITSASTSTSAADSVEEAKGAKKEYDLRHEPYLKITRVAVLPSFRGYGLSRLLMRTVEEWAAQNGGVIDDMYSQFTTTTNQKEGEGGKEGGKWNGLIGLHAQVQVERMYAGMGYVTDASMGRWDEEGIEHVGMFKRVDVKA